MEIIASAVRYGTAVTACPSPTTNPTTANSHGLRRAAFNAHSGGRGPPAVETRESAISTSPRIS
jgi:hypothetical protein